MTATLVLVNYHSADLAAVAIDSARSAARSPLEVVVVDNSVSTMEAERLGRLDIDRLIIAETNRGYGAGVNLALDDCSGDAIIVSNPDVVFADDSLDLLLEPLKEEGVALTGPAFFWDSGMQWRLPPPETMTFAEQFMRNVSSRSRPLAAARSRRLLERRIETWKATSPRGTTVLSGAVMAFRAAALRRFRFDERYMLYFEEVDLMRRLRRAGHQIVFVPESHVQHVWAQSSRRNPDSSSWFEQSRRLYQRKWFGRAGDAMLQRTRPATRIECEGEDLGQTYVEVPEGEFLIELGDSREFGMAAGTFSRGGRVELPLEAMRRSPLETFCCRVIDLATRETIQVARTPAAL